MGLKTLDEIMLETKADKASSHHVKGHGYARHYDEWFYLRRLDDLKLLEIGVGSGESIRGWLAYFECASIYGVDIVSNTNEWNTPGAPTHPRYCFLQGNQNDETMWKCWLASCGRPDIVIDDGGHFNDNIIITFGALWPALNSGGFYCVEDLNAGYTPGTVFVKPGYPDHKSWLHAIVDRLMIGPEEIDFAYFANELLILKKK